METKGERRDKKRESLRKKTSDNRKSVNLILDLIRKKSKLIKLKKN
jgi:adenylate kinase family enzyme